MYLNVSLLWLFSIGAEVELRHVRTATKRNQEIDSSAANRWTSSFRNSRNETKEEPITARGRSVDRKRVGWNHHSGSELVVELDDQRTSQPSSFRRVWT